MTNLSPEATNVLYASPDGSPLADQLQAAYSRNVAEGVVEPRSVPETLASVAAAAVAEAAASAPEAAGFDLDALTDHQRLAAEAILAQVENTYLGTVATIDALNSATPGSSSRFRRRGSTTIEQLDVPPEAELQASLETSLMDWANRGVLDYVADKLEDDPGLAFTLVATPVPADGQWSNDRPETKLQEGFKIFAEAQPNPTTDYIYDTYCRGYSRVDICGEIMPEQGLSFSLVPTKYTSDEVPTAVAGEQKAALKQLQADHPELGHHVSSPLAQLTRLFTLRTRTQHQGMELANFDLTFIRNFDLPIVDGCVPYSYVDADGRVGANQNDAGNQNGARVAVG